MWLLNCDSTLRYTLRNVIWKAIKLDLFTVPNLKYLCFRLTVMLEFYLNFYMVDWSEFIPFNFFLFQTSPTLVSNLQSTLKNTSKTLVNLKRDIKPQSRKKLHNLILSLTKNLLCQLSAFFIWRQVNISVNPQLIGNSNFLSNGVSNESFSYLTNKQLYHTKNGRPKAMLITDDVDGEFFNDRQQCKLCTCMCAFESIEASILLFLYNYVP